MCDDTAYLTRPTDRVMAALVAAIHVFLTARQGVDGRHKAGHDGLERAGH
jgi:hypothetical protein